MATVRLRLHMEERVSAIVKAVVESVAEEGGGGGRGGGEGRTHLLLALVI